VAATVAKPGDAGQRKSTEGASVPAKAAVSQPKLEEEPVIKLAPEHGMLLSPSHQPCCAKQVLWLVVYVCVSVCLVRVHVSARTEQPLHHEMMKLCCATLIKF